MTWNPQLVALDIDGTLVDANGHLPDEVRDAVRAVVTAGVPVVLSTGRGWTATQDVFDQLGLPPGWAVSANGAVVVNYPPLEIHTSQTFDPSETIRRVVELAPRALIAVDEGSGWRATGVFPEGELTGPISYESAEDLGSRPVVRIVVRDPNGNENDFHALTTQLGLKDVSFFIGWSCWLDIAPQGIDKAAGLQVVCDELGVDASDVLAIGDGRNDIEMLEWAGRGVAMGDAPPEVQLAADHVTGTFTNGGTAAELRRWFGQQPATRVA